MTGSDTRGTESKSLVGQDAASVGDEAEEGSHGVKRLRDADCWPTQKIPRVRKVIR